MFLSFKRIFKERITLKLIPHSDSAIFSISIPRFLVALVVVLFFSLQATTTLLLWHYNHLFEKENYRSIRFLERLDEVQQENYRLRNSVEFLSNEAERIKDKLLELQQQDQRIRELIDSSQVPHIINPRDPFSLKEVSLLLGGRDYPYGLTGLSLLPYPFGENPLVYGGIGGQEGLLDVSSFMLLDRAYETIYELKKAIPEQIEKYEVLEEELRQFSAIQASKPSIWPLLDGGEGFITSIFGYRLHPISRTRQFHEGIDIGVWYNTPVVATAYGVVEYSGWKGGFGRTVVIDHGNGFKTVYAHNNSLRVSQGDTVERGEVIAYSGNSGYSTGPHLHYEVIHEGNPQNPQLFF